MDGAGTASATATSTAIVSLWRFRPTERIVLLGDRPSSASSVAIPSLEKFAHIGVFSSGVFGITGGGRGPGAAPGPTWEERNQAALDDAELRKGVKLVWFATGKEDFLIETSRATVDALRKHGFDVV